MKSIKLTLLTFVALVFAANVNGQSQDRTGEWCKTDQYLQEQQQKNPALINQMQQMREQIRMYIDNNNIGKGPNDKSTHYIIPTVVHNITHDGGLGYVSKADIEGQLVTMNEDYQRTNSDASNTRAIFLPVASSVNLEFRLAHIDPNGNCTEGIVRLEDPSSADFDDPYKSLSYWDSKKYFNIWVVDGISGGTTGIIAGYAQFPSSGINNTFGIVVDNSFFGPGDRTMSHEVGHCFGLLHTFQSGCGSNCSNSGDWICDTPPSSTSTFGCNTSQNTCSNDASGPDPFGSNVVDQIENFMSYDGCQNMFTIEQAATAQFYLNSTSTSTGLNQLVVASNLAATGTADPYNPADCAPIADFDYNKKFICEGGTVTFSDNSYNATLNAWSWTFTQGTPGTSPLPNPTITYNTAGVWDVTYQPSSTGGTANSITKNSIITVSSLTADYIGPIIEGFENPAQYALDWTVINYAGNGQTWANNNVAFTTGSRSVRIRNFFNGGGDKHDLISPSFDISTSTNKILKFKQAFAKKSSANNDRLLVYWSTNCGESWVLRLPLTASSMATAPDFTGVFVPTSTQWVERTVDLTSVGSSTNLWFKFEFTEGGGNDFYLDDINIGDFGVGIDEFSNIASFSIYPNPTNSSAQISFNLTEDVKNLSIKVRNAVGQEVTNVINGQSFSTGKYTLKIDKERKLSSGIYFIEFNADDNVRVQKLIVQ